jgi:hypothetical protein
MKGWIQESKRHSLARQGVKTGRKVTPATKPTVDLQQAVPGTEEWFLLSLLEEDEKFISQDEVFGDEDWFWFGDENITKNTLEHIEKLGSKVFLVVDEEYRYGDSIRNIIVRLPDAEEAQDSVSAEIMEMPIGGAQIQRAEGKKYVIIEGIG